MGYEDRLEELGGPRQAMSHSQISSLGGKAAALRYRQLLANQGPPPDSEEAIREQCRQIALQAMPAIFRRWDRGARGLIPEFSDAVQVKCGTLLAGAANVLLEGRPGTDGRSLAELPLADLEASLTRTAAALHDLRAVHGEATTLQDVVEAGEVVPTVGTTGESGPVTDLLPDDGPESSPETAAPGPTGPT